MDLPLTLGIETTCDETGIAILRGDREILSSITLSQIALHRPFGGVLPELASREHAEAILPLIQEALKEAGVSLKELDLIGVAYGPGLLGPLLVGLNVAKSLSIALKIPFIGINHLEAHLFAALMERRESLSFPALGVLVSGGHTELLLCDAEDSFKLIGETRDDAIGEAFDKVAKMLGLPYPGGPQIEAIAKLGNPLKYSFRPPLLKEAPYAFSLSGLKTKVLYTLFGQNFKGSFPPVPDEIKQDVAASFHGGVFEDLIDKCLRAAEMFGCKSLLFGGGVTSSETLRSLFEQAKGELKLFWPARALSLDNGAMIGGLAAHLFMKGRGGDPLSLRATPRIQARSR